MDDWLTFILERYNYWIVILLMMTGLYTVFARGNLVKKIVGLNIFQTSVFIYYITIGKIAGGTAPIYMGGELDGAHHGPEEGGDHGAGYGDAAGHGAEDASHGGEALHAKIDNAALDHGNELKDALKHAPAQDGAETSLHNAPETADKIANTMDHLGKTPNAGQEAGFDVANTAHEAADAAHHGADAAHGAAYEAGHGVAEAVIYSNPLPHVLILTAIVVGVATTAVGLALAVRIREAYGTIEEDELEAGDEIAEFGHAAGEAGARA